MWRIRLVRYLSAVSLRNCSSRQAKPSCSSSPSSKTSTWSKTEKLKRRRDREDAIFSSKNTPSHAAVKWSGKQSAVYTGQTPSGAKKDTSVSLPPTYSPEFVESSWYEWWTKEGFFQPENHASLPQAVDQTFSMCIPPPNVTGSLHVGHALTVAVQDALVRWRRMKGWRVLWLPGCDHAGIATQAVVERRLWRDKGKRRRDLSRQELLQEAWQWKQDKEESIYQQLRKLGASLDWSRTCFTLDPSFSAAVTEAFVRLCDSGLIYRSEALVNWSCALESAISDVEVDAKQLSGKTLLSVPGYDDKVEFGTLYTFAYPVDGLDAEVAVTTSRPETMLGDVAVAVHPDDPHYQALHGKLLRHPFTQRLLPIVTDPAVDMDFGTGAVKVTPAHDHTDFQMSQRHSLPRLTVIGGDGTMAAQCGDWLQGVKRFDARHLVVNALIDKQLFRGTKSHAMTLPVCSRSGDIIEPLLKKQWFVRCEDMARRAVQAVEEQQLEIVPRFYTKTWRNWLDHISDWCISRQLWWGHQVPAYQVELPPSVHQQDFESELWVWGRTEDEARQRAAAKYRVDPAEVTLTRDPDVLDTWFSSALFPFAMLGWPQQTADLQSFYPNSLLETGSDLIFFWVARMVMLGTELTGRLPFKQVLFHSLVRDKHGRKMSKSLGNVINPMDVIHGVSLERLQEAVKEGNLEPREQAVALEAQRKDFPGGIPECGADALRFSLCSSRLQGEAVTLSVSKVLECRMFCNKMWQTLRFTLGLLAANSAPLTTLAETRPQSRMDQWICSRLHSTVAQCEQAFQSYELHVVTSCIYSFWLHCLCDVYLECVKPVVAQQGDTPDLSVLYHCVSVSLTLLSPFMPFISEELWQRLQPWRPGAVAQDSLGLQPYPSSSQLAHWSFPEVERDFLLVRELIRVTRSLRAQAGVTKERPSLSAVCSPRQARLLPHFESAIQTLGRISSLHVHSCDDGLAAAAPPAGSLVGVVDHTCRLHLHAPRGLNTNRQVQQLSQRRTKLLRKLAAELQRVQSPERLPADVKQRMDSKVSALQKELNTIEEQLRVLSSPERTR